MINDIINIGSFRFKKSKSEIIRKQRGIGFEELLKEGEFIESVISINPEYKGQEIFILKYDNFIWCIPYRKKQDKKGVYFEFATAFPKNRLKKRYPNYFNI